MATAGEKCFYNPDLCHKFDEDHNKDFLFRFAVAGADGMQRELMDRQVREKLESVRGQGAQAAHQVKSELICLGPKKPWPAIITAVHEDGTVDLEIEHQFHKGSTLGYIKIRQDQNKKTPHTWHYGDGAKDVSIANEAAGE